MNVWQPIDTASKDGTTIRVRFERWSPYHAFYKEGRWYPIEFNCPDNPTYWMPLK